MDLGGLGNEEFKMHEDDEDVVDLLAQKKESGNTEEFYEQQEALSNLKNQIMGDFKINSLPGLPGGG